MCSYDLLSKEFHNYGHLFERYSSGATVLCEYDGRLYVDTSYTEEQIDLFADDLDVQLRENSIDMLWRLDIETGELTLFDLPTLKFIDGGSTDIMKTEKLSF